MRLWSIHPKYLDVRGLVALWREGLLAQAVLGGRTRGYRHHPQLQRFRDTGAPRAAIALYLRAVLLEAVRRGYQFDASKISRTRTPVRMRVSHGQLEYEWQHLQRKLGVRSPSSQAQLARGARPDVHPIFLAVKGPVASWEVVSLPRARKRRSQ